MHRSQVENWPASLYLLANMLVQWSNCFLFKFVNERFCCLDCDLWKAEVNSIACLQDKGRFFHFFYLFIHLLFYLLLFFAVSVVHAFIYLFIYLFLVMSFLCQITETHIACLKYSIIYDREYFSFFKKKMSSSAAKTFVQKHCHCYYYPYPYKNWV